MINKLVTDIRWRNHYYKISNDVDSAELGKYYFIFEEKRIVRGKDQALIHTVDENGIPLNRSYIDVKEGKVFYFPISIGQMGLSVFHTYLRTRTEEDLARFLKFAQWFMDHREEHSRLGDRWLTDVALPAYKNPGPWQSAFAQGRGISILLRAFQVTGEKKYAAVAERALTSFKYPVSEGGVTSYTEWGPFYEEYTAVEPTLVLNGMIFSLCGIYDFMRVFPGNKLAKDIFYDGIHTLINILPEFDLGYWSRYNLCFASWYPEIDPATINYHKLHVIQLTFLYKLTSETKFQEYANQFESQITLKNIMKMYRVKYKTLKKINRI